MIQAGGDSPSRLARQGRRPCADQPVRRSHGSRRRKCYGARGRASPMADGSGTAHSMMTLAGRTVRVAAMLTGEWDWAESELATAPRAGARVRDRPVCRLSWRCRYRALQGEPRDELAGGARARRPVRSGRPPGVDAAMGIDAAADGRLEEARERHGFGTWRESGTSTTTCGRLHIATWLRDGVRAPTVAGSMRTGYATRPSCPTPWPRSWRRSARCARGCDRRSPDAVPGARIAWRDLGLPFEEALLGVDMATVLDPALPEVQEAVARSRADPRPSWAREPSLARLEAAAGVAGPTNGGPRLSATPSRSRSPRAEVAAG